MSQSPVTGVLLLRLFFPFALGYFVSYVFRTVNAVIAPDLVAALTLSPADLGLLTSAYFLAFAVFQLPLGVLLDRFGSRRVEGLLLLFAAMGALLFSQAQSLTGLIIGRALIGLGVSACLMAAFKAFSIWLPGDRLPFANGVQMVSGGMGALVATTPIQTALEFTDWRGVFQLLAGLTLVAAGAVYWLVPEQPSSSAATESFREQWRGLRQVLTSRRFWQIAPWAFTAQAAYLSIQGLWSGPWLRDVAGYDRDQVAGTLCWIALAMIAGYFFFGSLAARLSRRGIRPALVAGYGMGIFILIQALLVFAPQLTFPLWLGFGFFGTACILPYAILSQAFPRHLVGRSNTALNLLVFVSAFGAQWLIGTVLGYWPLAAAGGYHPDGYRWAFLLLIAAQLLAVIWYFRLRQLPATQKTTERSRCPTT